MTNRNNSSGEPTGVHYAIILTAIAILVLGFFAFFYGAIGSIFTSVFGVDMGIVPTVALGMIAVFGYNRWNKNRGSSTTDESNNISSRGHVIHRSDATIPSSRGRGRIISDGKR